MEKELAPGISHPLPDPLRFADGRKVATARDWRRRRAGWLRLFADEMYGPLPPKPERISFETIGRFDDALDGRAVLKLVTIGFGEPGAPQIDLVVLTPKRRRGRVPAFLGMNFCGNHTVLADTRVPETRGWRYEYCGGRGAQAANWCAEQILERGYALASFCSSDIDSDRGDVSDGVWAWQAKKRGVPNRPQDRGTIAGWAWGYHRCVDYLATDAEIDRKRIIAVGHSRNGKTALLAAATDERIALTIPLQSGCGGAAPSRTTIGETVARINTAFPHWFGPGFKRYNERPEALPFDQHCLLACVAPRPALLANAVEDTWANPEGQLSLLRAATPVYRLLGAPESDLPERAEVGKLYPGTLGYFLRPGAHSMRADDWAAFLDFADHALRR